MLNPPRLSCHGGDSIGAGRILRRAHREDGLLLALHDPTYALPYIRLLLLYLLQMLFYPTRFTSVVQRALTVEFTRVFLQIATQSRCYRS